jgi:hypothetical protein
MTPVQPSVVAVQRHVMLSAVPSSGIVSSMIRITGIGDRDRPEWLIRISGIRSFAGPIPIVCSGGTAMAGNFLARLKWAIAKAELPVAISEVYLAKDPLNATAKGALVGAMLNM